MHYYNCCCVAFLHCRYLLCTFSSPHFAHFSQCTHTHTHTSHTISNVRNFYFLNWKSGKICHELFAAATAAAAVGAAWNVYQFVIVISRFIFVLGAWHMLAGTAALGTRHLALATWHLALSLILKSILHFWNIYVAYVNFGPKVLGLGLGIGFELSWNQRQQQLLCNLSLFNWTFTFVSFCCCCCCFCCHWTRFINCK